MRFWLLPANVLCEGVGIIISGFDVVDDEMVNDLQQFTRHEGYEASDGVITSFWSVVRHRFNQTKSASHS